MDGFEMSSGFQISVSSELMAILAVSNDLTDLRKRIARMVVAYSRQGDEITAADLEVDGAMCAPMIDTLHPTLVQTPRGIPYLCMRAFCQYCHWSKLGDCRSTGRRAR